MFRGLLIPLGGPAVVQPQRSAFPQVLGGWGDGSCEAETAGKTVVWGCYLGADLN